MEAPADEARALSLYTRACDADEPAGCDALATVHENGVTAPRDDAKAAKLRQRAVELWRGRCDRDDGASCSSLGQELETRRQDREALALHEKACRLGDRDGCIFAAILVDDGRGADVSFERAFDLYLRACDLGDASGCESAASYIGDYGTLRRDREREKELEERARGMSEALCAKGQDRYSCVSAAIDYEHDDAPRKDKAFELYSRGCDLGNMYGCSRAAGTLEERKDAAGAAALRDRACRAGNDGACTALYKQLTAEGKPVEAAAALKVQLDRMERLCARNETYQCSGLFDLYEKGELAEVDAAKLAGLRKKLMELDRRECDRANAYGCTRLAKFLEEDAGALVPAATALIRTACELGEENACLDLSRRLAGDEAAAMRLRACELGEMDDACDDERYREPDDEPDDGDGDYGDYPGDFEDEELPGDEGDGETPTEP